MTSIPAAVSFRSGRAASVREILEGRELVETQHLDDGQVAEAAGRELIARLAERQIESGLVVDLGCGGGLTAKVLTDAGYDVLGVDISEHMLELASEHAPDARFLKTSLFDVDIPSCVAVVAIGESINYAVERATQPDDVSDLVHRIHEALEPGGLVLLDVAGPGRIPPGSTNDARFDGDGWALFVRTVGSEDGATLTRDVMTFRRVDDGGDEGTGLWRRTDERHVLGLYSPETVTERLLFAGFDVVVLSGYDDLTFPEGWAGFLGRKSPRS